MPRLESKVAVITGAASGIGRASAIRFAAAGASVVVADLDDVAGAALAEQIGGTFVHVDVASEASVEELYLAAVAAYGGIDVLFNNAGIAPPEDDSILTTDLASWQRVQDVNLTSVYLCCRYGIPHLQARGGGSVINTASFVALLGSATSQISYTASKGGVLAMSRELAVQFAREGIRVNALCPGPSTRPCCKSCSRRIPSEPLGASCTCPWAGSPSRRRSRARRSSSRATTPRS